MDPSLHLLWKNYGKICEHTESEHVNAIDWRETCVASIIFKLHPSAPLFLPLIRSGSSQVGFVFYWNLLFKFPYIFTARHEDKWGSFHVQQKCGYSDNITMLTFSRSNIHHVHQFSMLAYYHARILTGTKINYHYPLYAKYSKGWWKQHTA